MYISYKKGKDGREYATVMTSQRESGKSTKSEVVYLGLVVDRDKGIYRNRKRGTFTYDPEKGVYGTPAWGNVPLPERKGAIRFNLDFGDIYLLDRVMDAVGLKRCIDAMGTGAEETVMALTGFCVLVDRMGMCNAEDWWEGSYARILYRNADLRSQRISDALEVIGDGQSHRDFFIEYLKTVAHDGEMVALDSKGVVNAIDTGLTETSNHNGEVSIELRLITIVQLGTGLPLYFRVVPGNIVDAVTLLKTLDELKRHGINTAFAVVDAGYCTLANMDDLFRARVNFVTRLRPNFDLFKDMSMDPAEVMKPENRVLHNDRFVYIVRRDAQLTDTYRGYAYICVDTEARHKKEVSLAAQQARGEIGESEVTEGMLTAGMFILVSSYMIPVEDVLDVYYTRETAEQYFDLANQYASLTPLRVHREETIRGMMMLTFIASSLVRRIQLMLEGTGVAFKTAMLALRSQKCRIYMEAVVVDEPKKKASVAYRSCKVESPDLLPYGGQDEEA